MNLFSEGERRFTLKKESRALKIDGAVACCLSHVAARIVTAKGAMKRMGSQPGRTPVYFP